MITTIPTFIIYEVTCKIFHYGYVYHITDEPVTVTVVMYLLVCVILIVQLTTIMY